MTKADAAYNTRTPDAGKNPNSTVNEHIGAPVRDPASGPSRRGLLAGLAGGAFLAAGGDAGAAGSSDAALIGLGERYSVSQAACSAAIERVDECEFAYDAARPAMPAVLRHTIRDHFEFRMPVSDMIRQITDDEFSSFYSTREIEELRSGPRMRNQYWLVDKATGTREPCYKATKFDRDRFRKDMELVPFPEEQVRADEILAAWDAHWSACRDLPEWIALEAAAAAYDAAVVERLELGRQIAEARATTLDGLRIRAMIVSDMYDGDFTGGGGLDHALIWSTIRDLTAL